MIEARGRAPKGPNRRDRRGHGVWRPRRPFPSARRPVRLNLPPEAAPAEGADMDLKHIGRIVRREIRDIIPPTIFFFVAFGLLLVTQMLVLKDHGIDAWHWGGAVIGALIIAKIVLIADHFRFINRYPGHPLIWNALWKTLIYNIGALALRYLEGLLPILFRGDGFVPANRAFFAETDWTHFLLVHMWLAVLLFVYCCLRELVRQIGPAEVRRMFFGGRAA
jgi:hypothetical protein